MKALVLIEVNDGVASVSTIGDVNYHVIDWDVTECWNDNLGVGSPLEELPEEFAAQWPDVAEAVRKANADAEAA